MKCQYTSMHLDVYAVDESEARTGHLGKPFTTPQPDVFGGSIGSKPCRREYSCKALHVRHWPPGVFGVGRNL